MIIILKVPVTVKKEFANLYDLGFLRDENLKCELVTCGLSFYTDMKIITATYTLAPPHLSLILANPNSEVFFLINDRLWRPYYEVEK